MKHFNPCFSLVLLAFFVNSFIYFGFANVYSSSILNHSDFVQQFHSGIYQYRILSGHLLLWIYDILGSFNIDYSNFKFKFLKENSEPQMYLSLYILNVFFTMLCSAILYILVSSREYITYGSEKVLIPALVILLMAISQFVLVPYDYSSYFFLLLFVLFYLKYLKQESFSGLVFLSVLLIMATLNRESSALSLSFAATLLVQKYGWTAKSLVKISIFAFIFIGVYFGLRLTNEHFSTNDGNLLLENFTQPKNILGFFFYLFLMIFSLQIATVKEQRNLIYRFHFFALPYLAMCFYTGILYEIRLYMPIFITSVLLSRLNLENIKN